MEIEAKDIIYVIENCKRIEIVENKNKITKEEFIKKLAS